jgi:hypothetical protein
MENRIQVNGVWYVAEMTMEVDHGNDYDTINHVELIGVVGDYRVHIS